MLCEYCEEDALEAEETNVPDRISWRERWLFSRSFALFGVFLFLTFVFTQDTFTNYDVESSGACENFVSLECPRGNLECQSLP